MRSVCADGESAPRSGGPRSLALSRFLFPTDTKGRRRSVSSTDQEAVQALLVRVREGDRGALDRLIPLVYEELEELARIQRRRWMGSISVQTTSLLNQAYIRLAGGQSPKWRDRAHFMAVAATAMRRILIDHARRRGAKKRGGGRKPIDFDEIESLIESPQPELEARDEMLILLDTCLIRLAESDPRQAQIVECRFFAGMTVPETAEALDVSPVTVKRGWALAQAWLYAEMRGSPRA